MTENIKLMVAIPTLDYLHRKFVKSLTDLTRFLEVSDVNFDICFEGCTLVYISRDNLARKAILGEYEYVLWLDSDMVFKQDIFDRLYETGKVFVSANCVGRHGENKPCFYDSLFPPKRWDRKRMESQEKLCKIAGCGFGCVLTKTEILKNVMNQHGTCFMPTPRLGEDVAFCHRATEMGYDIWMRPDAAVGHVAQCIVRPYGENEMI